MSSIVGYLQLLAAGSIPAVALSTQLQLLQNIRPRLLDDLHHDAVLEAEPGPPIPPQLHIGADGLHVRGSQ